MIYEKFNWFRLIFYVFKELISCGFTFKEIYLSNKVKNYIYIKNFGSFLICHISILIKELTWCSLDSKLIQL